MLPRPAGGKGAWEWKLFHWRELGGRRQGAQMIYPDLFLKQSHKPMTFIGQTILETREQFLRVGSLGQKIKEEKIESGFAGA